MVHGVFNPQYQRYGKKILVGTDLNSAGAPWDTVVRRIFSSARLGVQVTLLSYDSVFYYVYYYYGTESQAHGTGSTLTLLTIRQRQSASY